MAHIPDGVLSGPVLIVGALATAGLTAVALKRLDVERIPQAAVLSSAFFVASLVSVPIGPAGMHLLLNGLMGLILGWSAVPALLVALFLQAILFGHGGIAVLGVNTLNLALPALACALFLGPHLAATDPRRAFWLGLATALLGTLGTGLLVALSLALSGDAFLPSAKIVLLSYLPLAAIEAAITVGIIGFLQRVAPRMLARPAPVHA